MIRAIAATSSNALDRRPGQFAEERHRTRKRLWQELSTGKAPQEAREEVVEGGLT